MNWLEVNSENFPLVLTGFFVFLIILSLASEFIFSKITGWRRLSSQYKVLNKPVVQPIRFVQVYWGSVYLAGNIYTVGASNKGLYLDVCFPFKTFHPPLLIPWQDIKQKQVKRGFKPHVQLIFGNNLSRPFEISLITAKKLQAHSHENFSISS